MGDFNTREAAHYIINQVLYYYEKYAIYISRFMVAPAINQAPG
jgi:hypothetical protein